MVSSSIPHQTSAYEPIAIIGQACRLPGGVHSPTDLWDMLLNGRSGISAIPASRFNQRAFYNSDHQQPEAVNSENGYFLDGDIRAFDNEFFGINNLEARFMDPQQRALLEVTFECLESAGVTMKMVSGSEIGCYIANFTTDYATMQAKDPAMYHRYTATGAGTAILANRISYAFNLKGPSVTLDTACSGSLYALHLACNSLLNGDCTGAIVGGANLIQSPEVHISTGKAGMTSPSSTSHTFDKSADGYARAEGVGLLYIKRLSDAIRDGDPIRSLICATAINSNGKSTGITLPSASGQEAVIRKAHNQARLSLNNIEYVEAHGTGTQVGDAIEIEALARAFQGSSKKILVGSVKPNLGHGEGVSGITSILKVVLALEHGIIPQTIGVKEINPKLRLDDSNKGVELTIRNTQWPPASTRRAGVNSFGYGGSNGHVILQEYPRFISQSRQDNVTYNKAKKFLFPLSASSKTSLQARINDLHSHALNELDFDRLAFTLACRRSHLSHRNFVITTPASFKADFAESCEEREFGGDRQVSDFVFVFSGQGAQWAGMGAHLLEQFTTFGNTIDVLQTYMDELDDSPEWTLRNILSTTDNGGSINRASISQPACTALQIALIDLLGHLGIRPSSTLGHSSGEIAAAYAAGFVSAKEAIAIAYYRGLAVTEKARNGAMAAVGLSSHDASLELSQAELSDVLNIACINSPTSVTLSGEPEALKKLIRVLQSRSIYIRKLKTDGMAYHSPLMEPAANNYLRRMFTLFAKRDVSCTSGTGVMISSVWSRKIDITEVRRPQYWAENLLCPVLFDSAFQAVPMTNGSSIIEIGPHAVLKGPCKEICRAIGRETVSYLSTMIRGRDGALTMLELLGNLYLKGFETPMERYNSGMDRLGKDGPDHGAFEVLTDLPRYKWDHQNVLWSESRLSFDYRLRTHPRHELLGSRIAGAAGETMVWRNVVKADDVLWLRDHKLSDNIIFPAAGYIAMSIEAFYQINLDGLEEARDAVLLENLQFLNFLAIGDDETATELFTELVPSKYGLPSSVQHYEFTITTRRSKELTVHARGLISKVAKDTSRRALAWKSIDTIKQASRVWYRKLENEGLSFGPTFQRLVEISNDRSKEIQQTLALAEDYVATSQGISSRYILHPTMIDAMFQTCLISLAAGITERLHGNIPTSIDSLMLVPISQSSGPRSIQAISRSTGAQTACADAEVVAISKEVLLSVHGIKMTSYRRRDLETKGALKRQAILRTVWKPDISAPRIDHGTWFEDYVRSFTALYSKSNRSDCSGSSAAYLDLLCHKNPGELRVLYLSHGNESEVESLADLLEPTRSLKRAASFMVGRLNHQGQLECYDMDESNLKLPSCERWNRTTVVDFNILFDVILFDCLEPQPGKYFEAVLPRLARHGKIVLQTRHNSVAVLRNNDFSINELASSDPDFGLTIVSKADFQKTNGYSQPPEILMVTQPGKHPFIEYCRVNWVQRFGYDLKVISLDDISLDIISQQSTIICSTELRGPMLSQLTTPELSMLQLLATKAARIIWLQAASILEAGNPEYALVHGLGRTIMMEQPSLKFFTYDVGNSFDEATLTRIMDGLAFILDEALHNPSPDYEFALAHGLLHVSRFMPTTALNETFNNRRNKVPACRALGEAGPVQLQMRRNYHTAMVCFTSCPRIERLQDTGVEVEVKALGLNLRDHQSIQEGIHDERDPTSMEFTGIVSRVGDDVKGFKPGDRVICMAPHRFRSIVVVPEWACYMAKHDEDLACMASVPMAYSTALYGILNLANAKSGESILIHSAASGVGLAAVQIAKQNAMEIFATVGTDEKKRFLSEKFAIPWSNIFSSKNSSFGSAILEATEGRGIDVILNSLSRELAQASWEICAEFGRFVSVVKDGLANDSRVASKMFTKSISYHSFDLGSLYYSEKEIHRQTWQGLLAQSLRLARDETYRLSIPTQVFDVSQTEEAFTATCSLGRIGKVAISLQDPAAQINVISPKFGAKFCPDKTYVLVGCLGGLGRALSTWMIQNGARRLAFLGRSGADRPAAAQQVEELSKKGAEVQVIRGDVACSADVENAMTQIVHPIGGVIHAAMGLGEAIFTTQMTTDKWFSSINPKLQGAWNLHHALNGRDSGLDFFLVTSSVAGSVGVVTESNYCAANSFLDAFARYRRGRGLPAISVGLGMISEVGYLHEHPEIEGMLLRKGIHPYGEEEMLQVIDTALSNLATGADSTSATTFYHFEDAHILTGLELDGLEKILQKGFNAQNSVINDPRAALMARALEASQAARTVKTKKEHDGSAMESSKAKLKHLLAAAAAAATATNTATGASDVRDTEATAPSATMLPEAAELVQRLVAGVLANLLLLPVEKLLGAVKLEEFGMDSMLAAEFRTSIFRAFDVDVPFPMLLADETKVSELRDFILDGLVKRALAQH